MTEKHPKFDRFIKSLFGENSLLDDEDSQQTNPTHNNIDKATVINPTTPPPPPPPSEMVPANVDQIEKQVGAEHVTDGIANQLFQPMPESQLEAAKPKKKGRPRGSRDRTTRYRSCQVKTPFAKPPSLPAKPVAPEVAELMKSKPQITPRFPIPRLPKATPPQQAPVNVILSSNQLMSSQNSACYLLGDGNYVMVPMSNQHQQNGPQEQTVHHQQQLEASQQPMFTRYIIGGNPAEVARSIASSQTITESLAMTAFNGNNNNNNQNNLSENATVIVSTSGTSAVPEATLAQQQNNLATSEEAMQQQPHDTAPLRHDDQSHHNITVGPLDSIIGGFDELFANSKSPQRFIHNFMGSESSKFHFVPFRLVINKTCFRT